MFAVREDVFSFQYLNFWRSFRVLVQPLRFLIRSPPVHDISNMPDTERGSVARQLLPMRLLVLIRATSGNSIPLICDSEKNTICSRTLTCRRWYCLHLHYISYSAKVIRPAVDSCYLSDAPKARISFSFSSDTPGS